MSKQRTRIDLDQWEQAIHEGFTVIETYDTADEGRALMVFVLHRRRAAKTGLFTPRMTTDQADVNLNGAFAAFVRDR